MKPQAVLLIGSTGQGKSCLGNYLLGASETFRTARSPYPETKVVASAPLRDGDQALEIIDTPGLNESSQADLEHMIGVVRELQRCGEVKACILCIKFDAKIDDQYKATVAYYSQLLPMLFETNVLVVLTNYPTDKRSREVRKRNHIDQHTVRKAVCQQIKEIAQLSFVPLGFLIDCVPYDDEERQRSDLVRRAILSNIFARKPVPMASLMVAKPRALAEADARAVQKLTGEIQGYNKRLIETNSRAEMVLRRIEEKERLKAEKTSAVLRLGEELRSKDSTEWATVAEWSASQSYKSFRWLSESYIVDTPCVYEHVDRWTNGHCEWTREECSPTRIHGVLEGEWFRGLYASLSLKAQKSVKYKDDIVRLKHEVEMNQAELNSLISYLEDYQSRHDEYRKEIELLHNFIAERTEQMKTLSLAYMTISEAVARLEAMVCKHDNSTK